MKHLRRLWSISLGLLLLGGPAAAAPILFQLDNVTLVDAAFPSSWTWTPGFPIVGSGDIDFGLGTGSLALPDHAILIDFAGNGPGVDAQMDVTGWAQTITAIDGSGNITSTGSASYDCDDPPPYCDLGPQPDTGWPPADGGSASSAILDTIGQTITVVDNSDDAQTGTVTYFFSYTITPEPGTALLVGGGLVVFGLASRRRRA